MHIEYVTEKAWARINLLRSYKFILDRKSLQKLYFTFIRSILEYADIVWDNCTQQQSNEIEKIQLEAGRIVSGTTKLIELGKLYKELGWLKLSERRDLHKLFLFFKMENGLTPLYLTNLIPPRVGDTSAYSLRSSENYLSVHANTRTYADSFLPSTVKAWNNLPTSIKSANTLTAFKQQLTNATPAIPEYYNSGVRLDQILHTRLRTECSSLNQHLFKRNLVESPNCVCGETESNEHFLLECPRYNLIRKNLLSTIRNCTTLLANVSTDLLLFGDRELSVQNNTTIFKAVHEYIKKSKRFAP